MQRANRSHAGKVSEEFTHGFAGLPSAVHNALFLVRKKPSGKYGMNIARWGDVDPDFRQDEEPPMTANAGSWAR